MGTATRVLAKNRPQARGHKLTDGQGPALWGWGVYGGLTEQVRLRPTESLGHSPKFLSPQERPQWEWPAAG